MADENVENLNERLVADEALRERFRNDPLTVLGEFEIQLDEDQQSKLADAQLHLKEDAEILEILVEETVQFWF